MGLLKQITLTVSLHSVTFLTAYSYSPHKAIATLIAAAESSLWTEALPNATYMIIHLKHFEDAGLTPGRENIFTGIGT